MKDKDDAPIIDDSLDDRLKVLENAEYAVDAAFNTGKADRAKITEEAQKDAHEAVRLTGLAVEADAEADEAARLAVIAENMGDREKIKKARSRARSMRREAKGYHKNATKAAREAYNAIKFSQPGKLGFMRVVQIVYAIKIASVLFALLMTSRDTISYDSVTIVDWITIILQGVGLWFFLNFFKITKPYVICVSAFGIVAYIITLVVKGTFMPFEFIYNTVWNVFLILYFSLSKRVETVLVNDFSSYKPRVQDDTKINRRRWPFVRNLIIYFIVFSILGHWMEAGMCQFIRLGWVQGKYDPSNTMLWRDWLYPYPMEGAAVVVIALLLYPLWQYLLKRFKPIVAYALSFVANALTCGAIEFVMGLIVNSNYQLWDYRDNFGNLMGQVCLQNVLAFGVAASLIAWVVYPLLERLIARVPRDTMNIVFVVIAVIGGILWSLYIIDPPENHAYVAPTKEQLEQQDRAKLGEPIASTKVDVEHLKETLESSKNLSEEERQKLLKQIEELDNDVNALASSVGYKLE